MEGKQGNQGRENVNPRGRGGGAAGSGHSRRHSLALPEARKLLIAEQKRKTSGFNSQSLEPVDLPQRAPTETPALVAMEVLSLMIRLLLVVDLVAAQLMVVVRAWAVGGRGGGQGRGVVIPVPTPQATERAGTGAGAGTGTTEAI